jgi:hypothetical protein
MSVALDRREIIIENLAVASVLGFLTLIIAVLSFVVDAHGAVEERQALAPAGAAIVLVGNAGDPSFDRVYQIQAGADRSFSTVITLRSSGGAALVAARFASSGDLQELRFLGSCASRLPADPWDLVAEYPGADAILGRAADFARQLANEGREGRS